MQGMTADDFVAGLSSKIDPRIIHDGPTQASVLVVIYGKNPNILMTKKSRHLRVHAGEIAFPGGKLDESDGDMLDTALRESQEELGLHVSRSQVIGQLEQSSTQNRRFSIMPFVCVLDSLPKIRRNDEVEQVLEIPAVPLFKTLHVDRMHAGSEQMYAFTFREHLIWGASARILKQITDILEKGRRGST